MDHGVDSGAFMLAQGTLLATAPCVRGLLTDLIPTKSRSVNICDLFSGEGGSQIQEFMHNRFQICFYVLGGFWRCFCTANMKHSILTSPHCTKEHQG